MNLRLSYAYAPQPDVSAHGAPYGRLQDEKRNGQLGFAKLPYQTDEELHAVERLAAEVRNSCDYLVVIGIGGSDLGTRALAAALVPNATRPQLFFLGDTTDPYPLREVLGQIQLERTVVVMVSKSGNTIEQMSVFLILRDLLRQHLGEAAQDHIITITDPDSGTLREITQREGYRSLAVPKDVGGRFSVFSTVGLFPLAVCGVDIRQLLDGARSMDNHDNTAPMDQNEPLRFAALNWQLYKHENRPITICMPYGHQLNKLCFWFRQLWAESLGKNGVGQTPIASIGPTDQHSQVQLYMEGPDDKLITFIVSEKRSCDFVVPEAFPDLPEVHYLCGHCLEDILQIEQEATATALHEAGKPNLTITLSDITEFTLGELLYFYELAVVYMGYMLGVNPFDQPGVELGKKIMREKLGA